MAFINRHAVDPLKRVDRIASLPQGTASQPTLIARARSFSHRFCRCHTVQYHRADVAVHRPEIRWHVFTNLYSFHPYADDRDRCRTDLGPAVR